MKKTLFIILFCAAALFAYGDTGFCEGWEAGYVAGYCYNQYSCLAPLVPLCPLPRLNEDSYQGGYNRGFLAGLNARR
jgi:hypothetical protein